ncbi:uncharacterized protein CTRU02_213395 [Colletotrichum truncatum]|uniref:Uncharacterized protein n=1 Tax=Colletotrichum truncatum TaxID=5467 RepID=A0ACC3YKS5_COLTU|nr:uncharacterized protein CTRU02_13395 [Colletotrichum truncatum]KAF6783405.1 hypothetical protein CTRU02_13395 [Colletotrichum truncatum]
MSSYCESSCDWDRSCHVDGCSKKHAYIRREGDIRLYSEFCADHTCKYCVFGESMCRKPKDTHHRFCSIHRKCGVEDCVNRGDCPPTVPLPWMCPSHICRVDDCWKQRHDHYGYCKSHRCLTVNCFERRVADSDYCVDHTGRICREENCREYVHHDFRCILHQKCPVKDCKHYRFRHKDGLWDHCEKHYHEIRCVVKNCSILCLPNSRYCHLHKCTFEGCLNFRDNEKDIDKIFCRDHGCEVSRCYAVAIVVTKGGGGFGPYCRRHTCTVADCREVCESGRYCGRHSCQWSSCEKIHLDGGSFCAEHECKTAGCRKKPKLRLGYCEEHCCKTDGCLNFCDIGSDKLCFEHSRGELHKKIKHLEDRLRGRGHDAQHHEDLKSRHEKLVRDYDICVLRLNESQEEVRILRSTWISEEDNRIWRKDLEDRNARLLVDLKREQHRVEHWERKAGELLRRIDELECLLTDERHRGPPSDMYERQIADLLRKVEILEEDLRKERENHSVHEGRRREVERLLRIIADLERKLVEEHKRATRTDELIKKVEMLQGMLASERDQKEMLLEEIAKRDEYDRCRREQDDRRRWRRGSWERRSRY